LHSAAAAAAAATAAACCCLPFVLQVKEISRGGFGVVLLALDKITGTHVALKFVRRGPEVRRRDSVVSGG